MVSEAGAHLEAAVKMLEGASYRVTTMRGMEEAAQSLTREPAPRRDVMLVEAKMLRSCLENPHSRCARMFPIVAKKVAIVVLQTDDSDAAEREFIVQAISMGVVDVIRYPLVKQNTANLWQHTVRKMIKEKDDPEVLETLKRSSSATNVHNFTKPFCRGMNVLDAVAYGEAQLRSPTPPMSLDAMNARQAMLLAETETRKVRETSMNAASKLKTKSAKLKRAPAAAAKKQTGATAVAYQRAFDQMLGTSPDELQFFHGNTMNRALSMPDMRELPLGLRLNYTDSFTKNLRQLECVVDSNALRAATQVNYDEGTYPSTLSDRSMSTGNGDDMDALDYVLMNSSQFGGPDDGTLFTSFS